MLKHLSLAAVWAAVWTVVWAAAPVAAQNPAMVFMVPVVAVPVIMAPPVMLQPMMAPPVLATPLAAVAAEPEGNMLSRLIGKIEVETDNEIRNGPEGPLGIVDYRPPPEPPQIMAVPVVMVPAGPTAQGVYTVRSGGSLAAVAARTGARLEDLIALNPALPPDRRLEAGTQVWTPFPWPR